MPTTASPSGQFARPKPPPVLAHPHDPFDLASLAAFHDSPAETHLLAAAVACPDRFFIAAPPGPRRDRCVNALLDELRTRGERVLVLTADADRANHWTETLLLRGVAVVRALADGEGVATLPPAVAAVSSHTLGVGRVEVLRARHATTVRESAAKFEQDTADVWEKLRAAAERCQPAAAADDDGVRAAKAQAALAGLRQELAAIVPQLEAKKSGSVFTRAFWKATFNADLGRRAADLEAQIRDAEKAVGPGDQTPLPVKRTADGSDLAEFAELCETLTRAGHRPPAHPTPESVAHAARQADADRREAEAAVTAARQSLTELETDPAAAAVLLLTRAAVVVGPRAAVTDPAVTCARVDRILLEDADAIPPPAWESLTARPERSIAVGGFDPRPASTFTNGKPHANGVHSPSISAHEFWRMAHRPLWLRTDDRLTARLDTALGEATREPLADRPEIELLFGRSPDGDYVLAEVSFPAALGVAAAKAFVAHDLGEVQLVPVGPARWHAEQLLVCWPLLESQTDGAWIDVAAGVREQVVPLDGLPATAAVSFDPTHWTREAAEAWVAEKTRAARSRRTAVLPEPALA